MSARYALTVDAAPGVVVCHAESHFTTEHLTADDAITYAQRLVTRARCTPLEYLAVCNLENGEPVTAAGCTFRLEDRRATYSDGAHERPRLFAPAPAQLPGQTSLL